MKHVKQCMRPKVQDNRIHTIIKPPASLKQTTIQYHLLPTRYTKSLTVVVDEA